MEIKRLCAAEIQALLPLVWEVFLTYEAAGYPERGKQAFWSATHDPEYLSSLCAYGAYDGGEAVGILVTREKGSHVALFFVKGDDHGRGIGRRLWNAALAESRAKRITVHSSRFAVPVYEKLGFVRRWTEQETDGIRYVPMQYTREADGT